MTIPTITDATSSSCSQFTEHNLGRALYRYNIHQKYPPLNQIDHNNLPSQSTYLKNLKPDATELNMNFVVHGPGPPLSGTSGPLVPGRSVPEWLGRV